MDFKITNGDLTVLLNGRIDSSNADDVEKEITKIREDNKIGNMILDADSLDYISSAGLRVVLRLKKAEP